MRILAMILLALLLAACKDPSESPQASSPEPVKAADPATAESISPRQPSSAGRSEDRDAVAAVVSALGDRVEVRYDRVRRNAAGVDERQLFMEVVADTVDEAEAIVITQLKAAGYKLGHRFEDDNGARQLYRGFDHQPIRTLARPMGVGPALKNPRATGSIYLRQ